MKTKETKEKSIMKQLRDIRDKLSAEMQGMTPAQVKKFIDSQTTLHSKDFWNKPKAVTK